MAVSHKDMELQNLQIWLAVINIDHGLEFPIYSLVTFCSENVAT